ncbi:hypothetical protein ACFQY7_36045 [Actinomadura luteofluorescens]|uniref:ParB/Sulfiredoxin domain-containing protein n=1 Tax=Actinomadura luteofluorescens TaxID=46163 RepID=A0A7Y9EJE8_9ACTN|nr:hypothetical protein [Actinomadura luteofluorescens]NYD48858.1 hypothetical protein [Actinomadura luteofluorescens]
MFVLLGWAWDVALAARAATRYPVTHARVSEIGALIRVDQDHAETVDLSHPLLAVPPSEVGTPIVIDGWHRLHKARQTGVTELPVVFLNADDERACPRVRWRGRPRAAQRSGDMVLSE